MKIAVPSAPARHSRIVRITHWITMLCFVALLVSGVEILISHPRFYWGDAGNVEQEPWLVIPIPASRGSVPTGYGFVLKDQNSWSRSLHFQAAWFVAFAALLYFVYGFVRGHFRRNLIPGQGAWSWSAIADSFRDHFRPVQADEQSGYNLLQRLSYLGVVFVLAPAMIWTGLAMSPGFIAIFPFPMTVLGGQQTARTIHFLVTIALALFLIVHVAMVWRYRSVRNVRAMITGYSKEDE
ncbi:MAG: cytochrome b/b6 domain-containing protein [Bryobacteraceae bacterium]